MTIDRMVDDGEIEPPDVVKIDVEGAEMAVIAGMTKTIEQYRPAIVYEVDDQTVVGVERKYASISDHLNSFGYTTERLAPGYELADWHVVHAIVRPLFRGSP